MFLYNSHIETLTLKVIIFFCFYISLPCEDTTRQEESSHQTESPNTLILDFPGYKNCEKYTSVI